MNDDFMPDSELDVLELPAMWAVPLDEPEPEESATTPDIAASHYELDDDAADSQWAAEVTTPDKGTPHYEPDESPTFLSFRGSDKLPSLGFRPRLSRDNEE